MICISIRYNSGYIKFVLFFMSFLRKQAGKPAFSHIIDNRTQELFDLLTVL